MLTTYQLDMAEELCERVVIIRQGQMVVDEPTAKLLSLFQQEYYELRFDLAHEALADQLTTLPLVHPTVTGENGQTLLTGALAEDVTIYQLLAQLDYNLQQEAQQGTLEQWYMSPAPTSIVQFGRTLATFIVTTVTLLPVVIPIMWGFQINLPSGKMAVCFG